jgi:hypothetical protein
MCFVKSLSIHTPDQLREPHRDGFAFPTAWFFLVLARSLSLSEPSSYFHILP